MQIRGENCFHQESRYDGGWKNTMIAGEVGAEKQDGALYLGRAHVDGGVRHVPRIEEGRGDKRILRGAGAGEGAPLGKQLREEHGQSQVAPNHKTANTVNCSIRTF
jgi:hypothetical protein